MVPVVLVVDMEADSRRNIKGILKCRQVLTLSCGTGSRASTPIDLVSSLLCSL